MIKKVLKWIGIVLMTPVLLFIILFILLYIPPIQNFLREKATVYASEATGMQIGIQRLSLSFPLNLVVKGVEVVSAPDTLLRADELTVKVQLLPLIMKKVEIDGVNLVGVFVNTSDLLDGMRINGTLGELFLESHGVNLAKEEAIINKIDLRNTDITLCLNDTTEAKPDTSSTTVNWKLLLHKLSLDNVAFTLSMPDDSVNLSTKIVSASLNNGVVDLKEQFYSLKDISIKNSTLSYVTSDHKPERGFDPSHIGLRNIQINLENLKYHGRNISAMIKRFELEERSGLQVTSLKGTLTSDSVSLNIPDFRLETLDSYVDLSAVADWSALGDSGNSNDKGAFSVKLAADIGKQDVMLFAGTIADAFEKEYPFRPLVLRVDVDGNLNKMNLNEVRAELPGAFTLSAHGNAYELLDSLKRSGQVDFGIKTQKMGFILSLLDASLQERLAIPKGMELQGKALMKGSRYETDLTFNQDRGKVDLKAMYDTSANQSYYADVIIDSLQIDNFLPRDSIYSLSAHLNAEGKGTDIFSPSTSIKTEMVIDDFQYAIYRISGIEMKASIEKCNANVSLISENSLMDMQAKFDAFLNRKEVKADLNIDISNVDLYRLHISQETFAVALNFNLEMKTDLKKSIEVKGDINNLKLITPKKVFAPKDLFFTAETSRDSTKAMVKSGDLDLTFNGGGGIERIISESSALAEELTKQLENKRIDQDKLRETLPEICLRLTVGENNPLSNYLAMSGFHFNNFLLDLDTSPQDGLNGISHLYALRKDSLQLDTIRFDIRQDTSNIKFAASVINGPANKQIVFKSTLDGKIYRRSADFMLKYYDAKGREGVDLGMRAVLARQGIFLHFSPENPTLVFRPFHLNRKNYIFIGNDNHVRADVELFDANGTGLKLYSMPDTTVMQDIAVEIRRIDLNEIRQVVPYMPEIGGLVSLEAHYTQTEKSLQVATDVRVDRLTYEKDTIGNIQLDAVYLPGEGDDHHLDAQLSHNGMEVMRVGGAYYSSGKGNIDADVTLEHFPVNIANAFIPEHMATLTGDLDGEVNMTGELSNPRFNGQLSLDEVAVTVPEYAVHFRFDNRPLKVDNSRLVFNKFNIYTRGDNPFSIDGNVDFSDISKMMADLRLKAFNYELLNAQRKKGSIIYGKVFVDLASTIRGPLDALVMRGNIKLLGTTDVTYVLTDSPLTVQDRLGDLVTFVNFSDTAQVAQNQPKLVSLGGLDMLMTVQIDQAVQLKVDLSPDRSSYVNLEGGGDLSLQYTPMGDLLLSGRYTLTSGQMKYSLMGIVSRTFAIQNGSYVDWSGNPMDPLLNITAVNRVRTSVQVDDQASRMVNFNASISIKNQLENLALIFNLEAPEDATIQNDLSAMSAEERSKQAVAMMITGSYMGSGGSGVNMGSGGLNQLLNNAIQGIAGDALKTIDISLGVETVDGNGSDGGGKHTDYSFQFSKRFWNNRISVIIGGKISMGDNAQQQDQAFIDNVAIEYRLDKTGTRYVKLFHDKNYDSILDGEITETGLGVVLRRKMSRLGELFIFRKKKDVDNVKNEM